MKIEIANLTALVKGHELNHYQRALALREWEKLLAHVEKLEGESGKQFLVSCFERMDRPHITMLEVAEYDKLADEILNK